jgi:hypothetical protein
MGLGLLPIVAPPKADFQIELTGTVIGRYKLPEKIGEGGFGALEIGWVLLALFLSAIPAFATMITDQRSRMRPYDDPAVPNAAGGDGSDIGALELQSPAPIFTALTQDGSNVWRNLLTEVGWSYQVESSDSLPGTNWTVVVDGLPGTGAELKIVDLTAVNLPMRFYRARTMP